MSFPEFIGEEKVLPQVGRCYAGLQKVTYEKYFIGLVKKERKRERKKVRTKNNIYIVCCTTVYILYSTTWR
jgi:hypothetical protein